AGGDRLPWPGAWPGREAIAQCCDGAPGQSWLRHAVTLGTVAVSSPAALQPQVEPGKALEAGKRSPLANDRNAACRHLARDPTDRACFLRDAAFLVSHLESQNFTPRALLRAKTGSGAAAYETATDPGCPQGWIGGQRTRSISSRLSWRPRMCPRLLLIRVAIVHA